MVPKKPLDDLIPPSRVRTKPDLPEGGVYFSLNLRDMIAELAAKVRARDPETLAAMGITLEPAAEEDEAPPETERSPNG